jgi:hypothetical protein
MIGDTDPEDAYDAGDPIPDRLANLQARIAVVLGQLADLLTDEPFYGPAARLIRLADELAVIRDQLDR